VTPGEAYTRLYKNGSITDFEADPCALGLTKKQTSPMRRTTHSSHFFKSVNRDKREHNANVMTTETDFKYQARFTATLAKQEPHVRLSKSTGREQQDQLFMGLHGAEQNKNMQ